MKSQRQRDYALYLLTSHWRMLRARALWRDERKCVKCGSSHQLHVHHKFYRQRFEDSEINDLITLCKNCHRAEHGLKPKRERKISRATAQEIRQKKLNRTLRNWRQFRSKKIRSGEWNF